MNNTKPHNGASPTGQADTLVTQDLSYRIGTIDILRHIDVRIGEGELIGFIGPNGAGKSTLLRLICGIEAATSGSIHLQHKPLAGWSPEQRARMIGYLVQGARAHWPISVERVVELGRMPHQSLTLRQSLMPHPLLRRRDQAADRAAVEQAMQMAEVIAYRNRIATTLSGGEQTLVMLARIFATCPQLMLADEPVAALDPYHQLHVMELLRQHASGANSTVVVLHDLSLAARYCDRLYLFQHGRIFASGTPAEVLTPDNLRAVYGIEAHLLCNEQGVSVTPVRRVADRHP